MKKCTYCGRECEDDAVSCSGCGLDEFEPDFPDPGRDSDEAGDWVTLMTCAEPADADRVVARLASFGIESSIPDEHPRQTIGSHLNTYDPVRVQVRSQDYDYAKALLSKTGDSPAKPEGIAPGNKKIIASLLADELPAVLERLNKQSIPVEVRTVTQESGLEISEVLVEDNYFERGCAVVEAWDAGQQAAWKQHSKIRCDRCGSRNYERIPHDKLGYVYKCKDCGNEFTF